MKYKFLLIILLLCLIPFSSGITYSIFHSENLLAIQDQEIAEFVFESVRTNHFELDFNSLKPGDTKEFEFQVANSDLTSISNVTIEYQITIKTFHFMPLIIELYKDDEVVMTCDETPSRTTNNKFLVCNSPIWNMSHNSESLDNYKLKITFDDKYNSLEYSDLVDFIDVDISSWQKIKE